MKTHQAKYETALERLTGEIWGTFERLRADMAQEMTRRDTEAARRESRSRGTLRRLRISRITPAGKASVWHRVSAEGTGPRAFVGR